MISLRARLVAPACSFLFFAMMLLGFHPGDVPSLDSDTGLFEYRVSMGRDLYEAWVGARGFAPIILANKEVMGRDVVVTTVPSGELPWISYIAHEKLGRCGGFMIEADNAIAKESLEEWDDEQDDDSWSPIRADYRISHKAQVKPLLGAVQESRIQQTIRDLSGFRNRYYRSAHGKNSQVWLMNRWKELAAGREDITVETFAHSNYNQPSVILTIRGTESPDEIVVLGGHGDSISGWNPSNDVLAPGADDNASGIATITEALRVLIEKGHRPKRTIQLMSYAAEEVGLLGSNDIAQSFKRDRKQVLGVMQLDMTNFADTEYDLVFMTDYTDPRLTDFLENLAKTYTPEVRVGRDQCGYACSDHASWNRSGYPAAIPFETRMDTSNDAIHTARDTIDRSGGHAQHAVPFAKLAVAYLVELGG